jgi:hypothetical protein
MTFIEEKFNSLLFGGVNLGSAMGEEEPTSDGGAKQRFESGTIYFHPRVGEAVARVCNSMMTFRRFRRWLSSFRIKSRSTWVRVKH